MRIAILIPPSEGKKKGGIEKNEKLSFSFKKPLRILKKLSEKDIKCTGKRYLEAINLNKNINSGPYMPSIERYSGEMYKALDAKNFSEEAKGFFEKHFLIVSGMYGLVSPRDIISNYKLPIEARGLSHFWKNTLTKHIKKEYDLIIDLLPLSYRKVFDTKVLQDMLIRVEFFKEKGKELQKLTHGVKKVKGKLIQKICEKQILDLESIGELHVKNSIKSIYIYDKRKK